MRIVVALGGNALLRRGERPDAVIQRHHVRRAAESLAALARDHDLIVCHGNGPQVGLLALESEHDRTLSAPYPLDVLVAQTQGMIGYWLAQELRNAGVVRPVVAVVTQTVVDADDPAFQEPTKFIGGNYPHARAQALAERHGWVIARDGATWRRVVASPQPIGFVEDEAVASLVDTHAVVVCGGGGGAPVVLDRTGVHGVEAVVDKDQVAAMLAVRFEADRLLVLTDVAAVMRDYRTADEAPIARADCAQLRALSFPAGSMGPKIDACLRFTEQTGRPSAIGNLDQALEVLNERAGTTVVATEQEVQS